MQRTMKYTVHSAMMTGLTPSSPQLVRRVFFCRVWRGVSWILMPFCYLGLLIAPAVIFSIPFQFFHEHTVSCPGYLVATVLVSASFLWMLYRAAKGGFYSFRQHVIHVDAIVLFVGLVFAAIIIVWLYPPK
jgi:hypothetical protein